jgi:hypothetical protein
LSKNDFVLLRKNISLAKIFDVIIISFLFSFIPSRLFYVLDTFSFGLLKSLGFFHIFKFSGLSFLGFIIGIFFVVYLFFHQKKATLRIFDICALTFFPFFIFSLFIIKFPGYFLFVQIGLAVLLLIIFGFLIRFHKNFTLSDGGVFFIFSFLVAFVNTGINFFTLRKPLFSVITFSQIVSVSIVVGALVAFLLTQKKFFSKK